MILLILEEQVYENFQTLGPELEATPQLPMRSRHILGHTGIRAHRKQTKISPHTQIHSRGQTDAQKFQPSVTDGDTKL